MIFETYVTSCEYNMLEYGFVFKASEENDNALFDMVLGRIKESEECTEIIERAFEENEKYARAVCEADAPKKV
jgi:hypothetical protein